MVVEEAVTDAVDVPVGVAVRLLVAVAEFEAVAVEVGVPLHVAVPVRLGLKPGGNVSVPVGV